MKGSRKILVLGGSSTLGLGVVDVLVESNCYDIYATYCNDRKKSLLDEKLPEKHLIKLDVTDNKSIDSFINDLKELLKSLDGVVFAYGRGSLEPFMVQKDDVVFDLFELNVLSNFKILRKLLPLIIRGDDASIVFISSIMGVVGAGGMSAYGASKAAVAQTSKALAVELSSKRIRVNSVAPGIIPSPLVEGMFRTLSDEQIKDIELKHPFGFGEPQDVGYTVEFLISKKSKWVNGVLIPVDGGYLAQ